MSWKALAVDQANASFHVRSTKHEVVRKVGQKKTQLPHKRPHSVINVGGTKTQIHSVKLLEQTI